jgi:hypothetical protein
VKNKKNKNATGHTHSLIGQDKDGSLYLNLMCPECEAAGVTLSDEDKREALLQAEAIFQSEGYQLTDLVAPEELPEVHRLLGRTKN